MRTRIQDTYYHKGLHYPKNFNDGTYATIPRAFKFDNFNREKSKHVGNELIQGWIETDEGRTIITKSPIAFKREDRVTVEGVSYLISQVLISEDPDLEIGELRNRPNRDIKMLVLG